MKKTFFISLGVLLIHPIVASAITLDKQTVLHTVLLNNPIYKATLADIDVADGSRLQASLRPNPTAVFEVADFAGQDATEDFNGAELTLGIQQKIELGGKRSNRTKVADLAYTIRQTQAKTQALTLLAEADYAYMRLAIAQARIVLAENRLALANKLYEIVKQRIGAAVAGEIEHTKAYIEHATAIIEQQHASQALVTAQADLARLLGGIEPDTLTVTAAIESLPALIDKDALFQAIQNAPQLQAQAVAQIQARSSLDLAHSQAVQDPTVGLGVRHFNQSDTTALVATVSVPIPIFNRNQGTIAAAKATIVKTDADSHATSLALRQTATQVWETLAASLAEAARYQTEIIPSARRAYQQADTGYTRGAFGFIDLLDAQRVLYTVQKARLTSLLSVYAAKAQVDFLMGIHTHLIETRIPEILTGEPK